jgi:hypothetical protein
MQNRKTITTCPHEMTASNPNFVMFGNTRGIWTQHPKKGHLQERKHPTFSISDYSLSDD